MNKKLINKLEDINKNKTPFVIWGAASTGRAMLEYLKKNYSGEVMPQYIVDNNENLWDGNNCKSPQDFIKDRENIKVIFVCVYVGDQVKKQIIDMGYEGEIILVAKFMFSDNDNLIESYNLHKDEIVSMCSMLADERSQKTVETFLEVIRTGDISLWEAVNGVSNHKLVDPNVLKFSEDDHFIDIGAFTGDTLQEYLKVNNGKYGKTTSFEPDESNYKLLCNYIESQNLKSSEALMYAVGKENGKLSFTNSDSESCVFSDNGNIMIDVVALDSLPSVNDMTILKCSTNGFDVDVMLGAKETIKKNKPQIATYIPGKELWEIPFLLKKLVPEYKLYIRHYGVGLQAMACYAVL